ncbi:substrate-binding domain-containing protein [Lyngbya confervoides]|uniref:Substrate-binding domain-containing protein n=1 Tax=Lyngbya confervoides BDU141951 TaxID=1574623 RepID=A0ABD4T5Q9_9CYAN|nr:substrate-binding domain-containing protein [Lyngbya confervoides]MCM1983872.1 substrate-binding domain-containing protein [Lyngbya confervoides BDU141951]
MSNPIRLFPNALVPLAQLDVTEPEAAQNGIALSDNTRVGPYSVLLKDAFERARPGQVLDLTQGEGSLGERFDLVALTRPLSLAEQRQGLQQIPVTREKIAIIVGPDNPFQGSLSLAQVAKIFKGEIQNWQQVGGPDRAIQLIHRPESNSARQALDRYSTLLPVTATDTVIPEDRTSVLIEALGEGGIGYAPASEVQDQVDARVVRIDGVSVDNPLYPFSQPLNYVYANAQNPQVQDFLTFLSSAEAQDALEFAQRQPADPTRLPLAPQLDQLQAPSEGKAEVPRSEEVNTNLSAPPTSAPPASAPPARSPLLYEVLPLFILALGLGMIGWLAAMRVKLEAKRRRSPRPAPNYAARLQAQGLRTTPSKSAPTQTATVPTSTATASKQPSTQDRSMDTVIQAGEPPQRSEPAPKSVHPGHQPDIDAVDEDATVLQGFFEPPDPSGPETVLQSADWDPFIGQDGDQSWVGAPEPETDSASRSGPGNHSSSAPQSPGWKEMVDPWEDLKS